MDRYLPAAILAAVLVGAGVGVLAFLIIPDPRWGLTGSLSIGAFAGFIGGWPLKGQGLNIELGSPVLNAAVTAAICSAGALALLRVMAAYA